MSLDPREELFKKEILLHPNDIQPRLLFADWLDEQGRTIEAHSHRWLAKSGKRPEERTTYQQTPHEIRYNKKIRKVPTRYKYAWWLRAGGSLGAWYDDKGKHPLTATLSPEIFCFLGGKFRVGTDHRFYSTLELAENDLHAAIAILSGILRV